MEQSLNIAWVLLGAFLVMFMQVGFALIETGFTRARHAVNTMGMNLVIYPVGVLGFWLVGYALMLGGVREWPSLGSTIAGASEVRLGPYGIFGAAKFALISVAQDPSSL